MPMTSIRLVKLLEKNGFERSRQNGSHLIMINRKTGITVSVPMHAKEMKKGTEQSILKAAGLK